MTRPSLMRRLCPPQMQPVAAPASVEPAAEPVQASAPSSVVEYTVPEGDIVYIEETAAETPVERVDEPAEVLSSSNASGSDKVERSIPAVAQPAPAAAPQLLLLPRSLPLIR